MTRKVYVTEKDGRMVTFAFTRPSESARARKINQYKNELEKNERALANLETRKAQYLAKIDSQISKKQDQVDECKAHLLVLQSEDFQQWLDEQRSDEVEAYASAEHFMKEHLGIGAYAQLMEKGELIFEVEERTFKITRYGLFYERQQDGEFRPRCVVRPKELPLPDFVISVLETIKKNPEKILGEVRT